MTGFCSMRGIGGSTNAGMDWNGMDYWNGQKNQIPWVNWPDWTCTWI